MSCNPIYADETIQMIGVVFCGGRSSRMGTDKGLLLKNETPWSEIALQKLETLGLPVYLSVNKDQVEKYSQYFNSELLIADNSEIEGPLSGLLTMHNNFPYHDLFILACDLPDISTEIIEKLYEEFRQREGEHDFFVFSQGGSYQPFLGIYTREGLQKISDLAALNKLEKFSMKYILEIGNTYSIELTENETENFTNYNSPEDFKHHPH